MRVSIGYLLVFKWGKVGVVTSNDGAEPVGFIFCFFLNLKSGFYFLVTSKFEL